MSDPCVTNVTDVFGMAVAARYRHPPILHPYAASEDAIKRDSNVV